MTELLSDSEKEKKSALNRAREAELQNSKYKKEIEELKKENQALRGKKDVRGGKSSSPSSFRPPGANPSQVVTAVFHENGIMSTPRYTSDYEFFEL